MEILREMNNLKHFFQRQRSIVMKIGRLIRWMYFIAVGGITVSAILFVYFKHKKITEEEEFVWSS